MTSRFLLALAVAVLLPLRAAATLILLSDDRSITASGSNSTGFSVAQTVTGTPFASQTITAGGGGSTAKIITAFEPGAIDVRSSLAAFVSALGLPQPSPGVAPWAQAAAQATFTLSFRVDQAVSVLLTSWRDNETLGGPISVSLTSNLAGTIPLNYTPFPFFNNLSQTLLLTPGAIYTLSGALGVGFNVSGQFNDGGTQQLDFRIAEVSTAVPDEAEGLWLLLGAAAPLLAWRAQRRQRQS